MRPKKRSAPLLHGALDAALCVSVGLDVALVVKLLALAKTDLDFCLAFIEINRQGNERQTLLTGNAE